MITTSQMTVYQGSCPICGWSSSWRDKRGLAVLEQETSAHIEMCSEAEKVGLERHDTCVSIPGRKAHYGNGKFLVDRSGAPAELLFVDEFGEVHEVYEVWQGHRWNVNGCPWLA